MQAQQVRAQQSVTSLSRYAPPRTNGVDPFHGYENRDFCNAFWGQGDVGPNVLFARMRGAERTTDELRNFWHERTNIEEEYAQKLAKLAKAPIGIEEVGELRESLNILRRETEVQATSHLELAQRMRDILEEQTAEFHRRQVNHRRTLQAAVEKKIKTRQQQESFAARAREKYDTDLGRINGYTQQLTYLTGVDAQRLEQKLARTKDTAKANEKDFITFTQTVIELLAEWQTEWKNFCDSCHDLEEDRLEFMKDNIWAYANEVSTLCVSDDQSCERVREALDVFEPERDVLNFAEAYGSGNELPQPPVNPVDANGSSSLATRYADFQRKSHRVPRPYPGDVNGYESEPPKPASQQNGVGANAHAPGPSVASRADPTPMAAPPMQPSPTTSPVMGPTSPRTAPATTSQATTSQASSSPPERPAPSRRNSATRGSTLPITPNHPNGQQPVETSANDRKILFYVRALYDYTATIDEEFDFQAGDIIAVTAAPEDGWWSGELLDEARKVEGKHIFPSNFVCLF